jgi:hypothetical protein
VLVDRRADRRVAGGEPAPPGARLDDGLRRVDAAGKPVWPALYRWALGFLELSVGRPDAALLQLDGLAEHWDRMGMVDHGLTHHAPTRSRR